MFVSHEAQSLVALLARHQAFSSCRVSARPDAVASVDLHQAHRLSLSTSRATTSQLIHTISKEATEEVQEAARAPSGIRRRRGGSFQAASVYAFDAALDAHDAFLHGLLRRRYTPMVLSCGLPRFEPGILNNR